VSDSGRRETTGGVVRLPRQGEPSRVPRVA
jgi:hypothetical protein